MAYSPCEKCDAHGLKILPTLYAALPDSVHMQLPPGISGKRVTDVVLNSHHYGLRIVREGYLYLIYANGPHGRNYAQAYRVVRDGTFVPVPLPAPLISIPEPACRRTGHTLRSSTIVIERPKECGEVFIAFAEHRWSDDTLKDYLQHEKLRRDRMQSFFPAKWVDGQTFEHGVVATQAAIETVVEYAPSFRPRQLQGTLPSSVSTADGRHYGSALELESTRYPLCQRYREAQELATFMHGPTATDTSTGKPCPPMLLALWDGIGITHELNGFRNDAGSMRQLYITERALQIDAMQSISAAHKAKLASSQEYHKVTNPNAEAYWKKLNVVRLQQAKDSWDDDYQPLIVQNKLDRFTRNFETFQNAVDSLQARRTTDVTAWLKAPLLLSTLQDYHETNLTDGIAFEGVIAEAIWGLPSEPAGKQAVLDLLEQVDPTNPASLIWRAYAYNQRDAKHELKDLLADIVASKATPMAAEGSGWEVFFASLSKLKSFIKLQEKVSKVSAHVMPVSATERFVKDHQIDRLVVTMGDSLFHWLGIGKLGAGVGAGLVKATLFMRIGISNADVFDLVKTEARVNPLLHQRLAAGYRTLRADGLSPGEAYTRTLQRLADDDGGKILRGKWAALASSEAGEAMNKGVRIGGVLAIIELFNFGHLLHKADKKSSDYALLVASGFASMSACLQASTKVMTGLANNAIRTLANLKAITGYFGGVAVGIGAVLDVGKAKDALNHKKYTSAALYLFKGVIGFGAATSNVLTALTSSAPLVARITGGRSVVFLGKVGAGIRGAAAASEAMAKATGSTAARDLAARTAANAAIDAAATDAGVVIGERGALLLLGRAVLVLAGWEVAVAITLIQVLIWSFEDDDLQKWLEKSYFGIQPNTYTNAKTQHDDFEKALQAVGLQANEEPA